jgi:hypothetical protein
MPDIRKVVVQTARPRGDFAGAVEEGFYTVEDGKVLLIDSKGTPIDKFKFSRTLKPGQEAHSIAAMMLRQWKRPKGYDFNRPLRYPRIAY